MRLSIIIPIYIKPLDKIKRSINSVLSQTLNNIELILVYQWFSDESYEYIQQVCKENNNVILFYYKAPLSHHIARIKHINDCSGKYVGFLDSDDYVDPTYYENCVNELEKNNADATPGNLKTYINNELKLLTDYRSISKDEALFGEYWLRGIFLTEKAKLAVPMLNQCYYWLTHHDDFLEKIILFHYCDKIILIKSNSYYHFYKEAKELDNLLNFKILNSVNLIHTLLFQFVKDNYSYCFNSFKIFISNILYTNKIQSFPFIKEYQFNKILKVVHNNNFNLKYYRINWYDNIICEITKDASEDFNKLFLQFFTLYNYGGIFCLDDYYFKDSVDTLFDTDLVIFENTFDIIASNIQNYNILQCLNYLMTTENNKDINYYIGNMLIMLKKLDVKLLPEDQFNNYFIKVRG